MEILMSDINAFRAAPEGEASVTRESQAPEAAAEAGQFAALLAAMVFPAMPVPATVSNDQMPMADETAGLSVAGQAPVALAECNAAPKQISWPGLMGKPAQPVTDGETSASDMPLDNVAAQAQTEISGTSLHAVSPGSETGNARQANALSFRSAADHLSRSGRTESRDGEVSGVVNALLSEAKRATQPVIPESVVSHPAQTNPPVRSVRADSGREAVALNETTVAVSDSLIEDKDALSSSDSPALPVIVADAQQSRSESEKWQQLSTGEPALPSAAERAVPLTVQFTRNSVVTAKAEVQDAGIATSELRSSVKKITGIVSALAGETKPDDAAQQLLERVLTNEAGVRTRETETPVADPVQQKSSDFARQGATLTTQRVTLTEMTHRQMSEPGSSTLPRSAPAMPRVMRPGRGAPTDAGFTAPVAMTVEAQAETDDLSANAERQQVVHLMSESGVSGSGNKALPFVSQSESFPGHSGRPAEHSQSQPAQRESEMLRTSLPESRAGRTGSENDSFWRDVPGASQARLKSETSQPFLAELKQAETGGLKDGMPDAAGTGRLESILSTMNLENKVQAAVPEVRADAQAFIHQTAEPILHTAGSMERGEARSLSLSLNPAHLGRLEIRLTRDEDGKINALLTADRADTQHILADHIPELRHTLENAGVGIDRLEIRATPESQSLAGHFTSHSHDQSRQTFQEQPGGNRFAASASFSDDAGSDDVTDNRGNAETDRLLSRRA